MMDARGMAPSNLIIKGSVARWGPLSMGSPLSDGPASKLCSLGGEVHKRLGQQPHHALATERVLRRNEGVQLLRSFRHRHTGAVLEQHAPRQVCTHCLGESLLEVRDARRHRGRRQRLGLRTRAGAVKGVACGEQQQRRQGAPPRPGGAGRRACQRPPARGTALPQVHCRCALLQCGHVPSEGVSNAGGVLHLGTKALDLSVVVCQPVTQGAFEGVNAGKVREQREHVFNLDSTPRVLQEICHLPYAVPSLSVGSLVGEFVGGDGQPQGAPLLGVLGAPRHVSRQPVIEAQRHPHRVVVRAHLTQQRHARPHAVGIPANAQGGVRVIQRVPCGGAGGGQVGQQPLLAALPRVQCHRQGCQRRILALQAIESELDVTQRLPPGGFRRQGLP
mmetsp:Transcript_14439/g.43670  ORF Transcript_14439/g.43670 Transcript_14439/m.43670 type:complete len:390 (+) Transcript_14439:361-1530(+)